MISNYHTAADVVPGPGNSNYNYTFDDDPVAATTKKGKKKKGGGGWGRAFGRKSGKVSPADQHLPGQLTDRIDSLSFSTDNSSNAGQETNSSASSAVFRMLEDESNKLANGRNSKKGGFSGASSAHSTTSGSNYSTDGSLLGTKLINSANNSVASSSMGSLEGEKFLQDLHDSNDLQNHPGLDSLKSNTNRNHSIDDRQRNYRQQQQQLQQQRQYQQDSSSKQIPVQPRNQEASSPSPPRRDVPLADDLIPTWFCGVELPKWLVLSI